jgi:hypothetical protein
MSPTHSGIILGGELVLTIFLPTFKHIANNSLYKMAIWQSNYKFINGGNDNGNLVTSS